MKRLAIYLGLLLTCLPTQAAYSGFIHISAANSTGGSATVTTGTLDTTGKDICWIAVGAYALNVSTTGTVSDSKSNTWTAVAQSSGTSQDANVGWYYSKGLTVGSGHTFSYANGAFSPIAVLCAAGALQTGGEDQKNDNRATEALSTTVQGGSVTPSEDNEVVLSAIVDVIFTPVSIDSSFILDEVTTFASGVSVSIAIAHKVQTTAGAENPTWTQGGLGYAEVQNATFKAATGAATSVVRHHGGLF